MRVPPDLFSLRVEETDGVALLRLAGRFDAPALPALVDAIGDVQGRDVVLDLQELTSMDWAAWLALMHCEHRVRDCGHDFRLVNARKRVRKIFELTETDYLLSEGAGQ